MPVTVESIKEQIVKLESSIAEFNKKKQSEKREQQNTAELARLQQSIKTQLDVLNAGVKEFQERSPVSFSDELHGKIVAVREKAVACVNQVTPINQLKTGIDGKINPGEIIIKTEQTGQNSSTTTVKCANEDDRQQAITALKYTAQQFGEKVELKEISAYEYHYELKGISFEEFGTAFCDQLKAIGLKITNDTEVVTPTVPTPFSTTPRI